MPILDAALAFALTMLLTATVVSQLVTFIQRFLRTRQERMAQMLDSFFDGELEPVIRRELRRLASQLDEPLTDSLSHASATLKKTDLFTADELHEISSLDTAELIERLKRSALGGDLLEGLGEHAERVFEALGARWEAVGQRFTVSFRTHAGVWGTAIALALAIVFNIDSVFILDSYISDRNLAASVAGNLEQIQADAERVIALAADTTAVVGAAAVAGVRDQIERLAESGLPIGWDLFPHACVSGGDDPQCQSRGGLSGWALWMIGVLLTGGLAGRGAPFWYDVVGGIARVARVGRGTRPARGS